MFLITSKIDDNFSIGTFYSGDNILIHNWTNFINASKYCRDNSLTVDINNWLKSKPVIIETYKWIQEQYNIKPTFFSPHGFELSNCIYMHPILFQLFIVDINRVKLYRPSNSINTQSTELNELLTNCN